MHLAVREGTEVLYVDRLRGSTSVPIVSTVGSRLPCTPPASARCCWRTPRPTCSAAVLADLTRVTAYTITQPGTLQRQLAAVRRDDYATTVEEMSLGACSVGVPVRRPSDGQSDVVAALGIVVPSLKRDRARLVSALQVAARGIGRAIA